MTMIAKLPTADLGAYGATGRDDGRLDELKARANRFYSLERFGNKRMNDEDTMREVAAEFTGFFLGEVFKSMNEHKPISEFGTGGRVEKIFREMSIEEYGRSAAQKQNNPLTELVYQSLLKRPAGAGAQGGRDAQ
jgi:Rod binding domain-containing protein